MKVAALYDVHGMPWALEAALRDVAEEGVDLVVFGGDLIYGPYPTQALELARSVEARFVRGNCERKPTEWDRAQLGPAELRMLEQWPMSESLDDVLYCHATPTDDLPATTASTPPDMLEKRFGGLDERMVVIGHTHHQFDLRAESVRVVNAGSVGMPYEDDVAAFWTLVEDGEPAFRRSEFDVERAVAEVRSSGWPRAAEFVAGNLLTAQSRDAAIAEIEASGVARGTGGR